jgi:hypothetical protein
MDPGTESSPKVRRDPMSGRSRASTPADVPDPPEPRPIRRIRGRLISPVRLRSSSTAEGPRLEIRQSPHAPVIGGVTLFVFTFAIFRFLPPSRPLEETLWFSAVVACVWTSVGLWRARAWVAAGPEGFTARGCTMRQPRSWPWSEIDAVRFTYRGSNWRIDTLRTTVSIRTTVADDWRDVAAIADLSSPRESHDVSLAFLATCHRYGAAASYALRGGQTVAMGTPDDRYDHHERPQERPFGN